MTASADPGVNAGREPAIRMIAMPADANPSDDIFGGCIMSLMGSNSPKAPTRGPSEINQEEPRSTAR